MVGRMDAEVTCRGFCNGDSRTWLWNSQLLFRENGMGGGKGDGYGRWRLPFLILQETVKPFSRHGDLVNGLMMLGTDIHDGQERISEVEL